MISRARKKAMSSEAGPFDIEIEAGVKARLYPRENRCEKRAFAGVQIWDALERAALKAAIETPSDRPFVFLDVGANVGLYSLFAHAYAQRAKRDIRILAIEPGLETCARLEANIAANAADIQIIRAAVSDMPGTGYLSSNDENRGEARLDARADRKAQEVVVIDTLPRICRTQGLTHIDAMKLDVEGHDLKALTAFFEDASENLHPELLIIETHKDANSPLIALCTARNYSVQQTAGLNTILSKTTKQDRKPEYRRDHNG